MAKERKTFGSAKNRALHLYHKCAEKAGCLSTDKRKARRARAQGLNKMIGKNTKSKADKTLRSLFVKFASKQANPSPMKTRSNKKSKKKKKKSGK